MLNFSLRVVILLAAFNEVAKMHFDEFLLENGLFLFLLQFITNPPQILDLFIDDLIVLGL